MVGGMFHEKRQVFPEGSRLETGVRDPKVYLSRCGGDRLSK